MRNSKPPVPFRPLTQVPIPAAAADALNAAGFRAQNEMTLEGRVNEWMGDPKGRAASYAESLVDPNEDPSRQRTPQPCWCIHCPEHC